jgi:hypothetical protein
MLATSKARQQNPLKAYKHSGARTFEQSHNASKIEGHGN